MYRNILGNFPLKEMRLAFAYGSGVFQQQGHINMSKNMIDLIFVVNNPISWHEENMNQNSGHYSFLKFFGSRCLTQIQDKYGAGVYFNTLVPCEGRMIKYGVISVGCFMNDLLNWDTLYIAGRLHKPVNKIHSCNDEDISSSLITNNQSAVHASLLMLPQKFSEMQLYEEITSLSYSGDFRMVVGEDKNKIRNIVVTNMDHFRELYGGILEKEKHLYWNKTLDVFEQDMESNSKYYHLNMLPKNVCSHLYKSLKAKEIDTESCLHHISQDSKCSDYVKSSICDIVKKSSLTQSVKGIATAGIFKSVIYSSAKLKKMWKSKK